MATMDTYKLHTYIWSMHVYLHVQVPNWMQQESERSAACIIFTVKSG